MSPDAAGIPMARCKRRLATVWFALSGLIFLLLVVQTVMGRYGDGATDAWGWFLPNVMPTLSLIVAVLVLDQMGQGARTRTADRFLPRDRPFRGLPAADPALDPDPAVRAAAAAAVDAAIQPLARPPPGPGGRRPGRVLRQGLSAR